ncbi:MAG: hypothetical protein ACRDH7_03490 [Actinomycetota bacterium]
MTVVRRSLAVVAVSALVAAGCHSAATPSAAPSVTAPGRFTRADLDAIVLRPSDAPTGTVYVDAVSGFQDLTTFARDDVELAHLRDDGFQVGHLSLFFPAGHANGGAPKPLTNDSVIVQGIAALFQDADGAERSLERYVGDLRIRQIPDAHDVVSDGLGDRAFGLQGTTPDGSRVLMYVWRVDNLVLAVSGSGPVEAADVRALADRVNGRAD